MRKDTTKKFLMREDRHLDKMLSKDIVAFILRKKINIDTNQICYDDVEFRNVFSIEFTNLNTKNILESGDKIIREIVSKNGKRIEFKRIEFNMIYCKGNKSLREFTLGETEVTQELYELVMGYNPSEFKGILGSNQRPVEYVTWYDAIMFCNKLSLLTNKRPYYEIKGITYITKIKDGIRVAIRDASVEINKGANGFRLPSQQEWEYAARAGTNNLYAGTNDVRKLEEYAWFLKNSHKQTHPVATKKPNEWGLYDMTGNVYEWCYDLYTNTHNRVLRGSGWADESSLSCSVFCRDLAPHTRIDSLGFRVSASL